VAYLIKSDDVHIGGEIITETAPSLQSNLKRLFCNEEIASKQLIHLHLIELLKRIGTDASYQIHSCTVDSLRQLKQIVESGGGKLHLHVDLPDGSHHGFKI
jgi:hypothetical protein